MPFSWAFAIRPDGTIVRVNGQHSSHMLSKLNGDMPEGLTAILSTYKVEDRDGEVALFRQFDSRKSARSVADVAGALQALFPNFGTCRAGPPREPLKASLGISAYCWRLRSEGR